jgi:hypothetical protein
MSSYHLLIVYRNFLAKSGHASHVGLGCNGHHTARVLRANGVLTDLLGVWTPADIDAGLSKAAYTHCIIEAPWLPTADLTTLLNKYPRVEFIVRCHSQIGFLQVEPGAIALLREGGLLEAGNLNFTLAANSRRYAEFFQRTYGHDCAYLPNLYDYTRPARYLRHLPGQRLRIGSFGALRLMKNHTTAAATALLIAKRRRADLEFHISVNREENPGAKAILMSLRAMFADLNWATLVEVPWAPWAQFRNMVATMDLCLQLSQSETFNIVTADAAAECVPSVVSEAIDWVPRHWVANSDNPEQAARVGDHLISDPFAGQEGHDALVSYVDAAVVRWKQFLTDSAVGAAMGLAPLV